MHAIRSDPRPCASPAAGLRISVRTCYGPDACRSIRRAMASFGEASLATAGRPGAGPLDALGVRARTSARELWRYRELLWCLVVRELKVKYQHSTLGFVWTLLNPLLTLAILLTVFSLVVRIPIEHYWAFLLSGYFVFNFVNQVINASTDVLADHKVLIRSVPLPTEVAPLAVALSRLVEFAVELLLVLALIAVFHHGGVPASFALLPLLVVLQLLLTAALALPVATLSVFYQDVRHLLPIAFTAVFYISPVLYGVDLVPDLLRPLYELNPIARLLVLYHAVLYEGVFPSFLGLAFTCAYTLALLAFGAALFRKHSPVFPEVV
jgi:lipopolysaccharide transport system permease protein